MIIIWQLFRGGKTDPVFQTLRKDPAISGLSEDHRMITGEEVNSSCKCHQMNPHPTQDGCFPIFPLRDLRRAVKTLSVASFVYHVLPCVAGAKRGGGRGKGERERVFKKQRRIIWTKTADRHVKYLRQIKKGTVCPLRRRKSNVPSASLLFYPPHRFPGFKIRVRSQMFVRINGIIDKSQTNIAANMESIRGVHEQSHEIIVIIIIIIIIIIFF